MAAITPAYDRSLTEKEKHDELQRKGSGVLGGTSSEEGDVRPTNYDFEQQKLAEGEAAFHSLGWKRLTIVLIVTAVALGSLSLPHAFASLGMVGGVITSVGVGLLAMYCSYVVGQMKIKYPEIAHYTDAGYMMFGKWGGAVITFMFVMQLVFTTGSHVLTGAIMFNNLTDDGACTIVFAVVSGILLFLLAIPPTFSEMAILGYIDFVSILGAILITIIATAVTNGKEPGGLAAVNWSAWPKEDLSLSEAVIAITNIMFAYSYALCQFSFMDEMHTPKDFDKAIWTLGSFEIVLYTLTGALIYAFVGQDVRAPALLSAGPTMAKVAFGVALPVIFISGSINTVVLARYLHQRVYKDSVIRYVNTKMGWITWIAFDAGITLFAWVIAEAIPFFSPLLALCGALFITAFTFYLPGIMWFMFIKEGRWTPWNMLLAAINIFAIGVGVGVLGLGTYAAVEDIKLRYDNGSVGTPFSCAPIG
ncbi:transmembrane amino acid transporter protein-domain-containing protein [Podospora australis]|uniref:Transmembrane amino acid transporter protein-domain-containing protein n=1 Tax=Podospora australis TaxID=1536484 RepID=A0AAN6WYB1_9PEZI|nr:transmembrane amino acid transporter protein-domain-containing protein [Podospora australis]